MVKYILRMPVEAIAITKITAEGEDGSVIEDVNSALKGGKIIHDEDGTSELFTAAEFSKKYVEAPL